MLNTKEKIIIGAWLFLGALLPIVFSSCKTHDVRPSSPMAKNKKRPLKSTVGYSPPKAVPVTFEGKNHSPAISPNGDEILFVSGQRTSHKHRQIYKLDLNTKKERRITFSDGDSDTPLYHPKKNKLYYASTTDEIKERAPRVSNSLRRLAPEDLLSPEKTRKFAKSLPKKPELPVFELYSSSINGSHIQRLTHAKGFDAQPSIDRQGNFILFSTIRKDNLDIFVMNDSGRGERPLVQTPRHESEPQIAPDGRSALYVLGKGSKTQLASTEIKNPRPKVITHHAAHFKNPAWHPSGKWIAFSSNHRDDNFELYLARPNGSCHQRLTFDWAHDKNPVFHPNGKSVYFVSNRQGTPQVYEMPLKLYKSCPESHQALK